MKNEKEQLGIINYELKNGDGWWVKSEGWRGKSNYELWVMSGEGWRINVKCKM